MLLCDLTSDLIPPQAAWLSGDVALITLTDDVGDSAIRSHFPLKPPFGTVAVSGSSGSHRIAAVRLPGRRADDLPLELLAGQGGIGPVIREDAADLADELDPASCQRLLAFLLGFCRTAFGLSRDAGFARTCVRIASLCSKDAGAAEPIAFATPAWMVVDGAKVPQGATLYIFSAGEGVRLSAAPAVSGRTGLRLIEPVRDGDRILALCDAPMLWTVRRGPSGLPDVAQASVSRGTLPLPPPVRAACLQILAEAGGSGAALLREMQVLAPAAPRRHDDPASPLGAALEAALPDGEGGIFLRGWLRDPLNLLEGAEIRTPVATARIDPACLWRVRRPDLAGRFAKAAFRDAEQRPGFVAHVPDPSGGLCTQPILALRLRSGNAIEVAAPLRHLPPAAARDAVLSCVPPEEATPALLDACLGPAAAALHRQTLAARSAVDVVQIGRPVRQPTVSIVVPLYRNLDFLRFQVAALAGDPECRQAELILALDSPEQRAELEHLLRGLHALHDMPFTLAVMPSNLGYAAANNMAVAAAGRAPTLLLLNSDVVPAKPGWLETMRGALAARGVGAAGPKLLFDDGSIQHAGLYFERDAEGVWYNAHYHKGMPRQWPAAQRRRRVPGVTGAALMVRRALFDAVGGITEDYIVGDYEDSDFCLKLHEAGSAITYVPEAELYHFERRSIRLHRGYSRTLAALYNRRLHHRRWDEVIAAVMARHPIQGAYLAKEQAQGHDRGRAQGHSRGLIKHQAKAAA